MKNKDELQLQKAEIMQAMTQAIKDNNDDAFAQSFTDFTEMVQEAVMAEAKGMVQAADSGILTSRGVRQLTSEETTFWQNAIEAMKSADPKQALSGTDYVLPKTTIDAIFEDLRATHPLLEAIDFQNTGALVEMLFSTTSGAAAWGDLTAEIISEMSGTFTKVDLTQKKLSGFMLVAKAMLDLGPAWMDRYAREVLMEALAVGLEAALVDGDGKDGPLGMTRALTGAVDGVYPRKSAITITDMNPTTFGTILNTLSQGPNGKRRAIKEIVMVVNPQDYFTRVLPATTVRAADGSFANNVFPFPTKAIQSPSVPVGYAVFGIAAKYFFAIGTSKGGKLEYDDSYKFLEDVRTYLIKLYGTGQPKDANAFVYADISGLVPYVQQVLVTNGDGNPIPMYPLDARLSALGIGALTLTPTFDKDKYTYTAPTTNASNAITAVSKDTESTVAIDVDGTVVANGDSATWAEGDNIVTITVTNGAATSVYTVVVTKS